MPSKLQDVAKSNISPVLFMTVDGKPMCFFLRPGPVKRKLQPLITAGAGTLCNVQQPGSILLVDPDERGSIPESSAHWFVSTQYIYDCIDKGEQLNLEDYRLNPEVVPKQSPRLNTSKESSTRLSGGRVPYTAEEDDAILSYVSKHKTATGGNRLWQEMEKQHVTSHSWQSMKFRYRAQLAKKQPEVAEVATTEEDTKAAEGETKVEGNQETDVQKTSSAEDSASAQTVETDLTQIDAKSEPSENAQPEVVEAQTSIPPQEEEQHVNPQTDKQPAGSRVETVEAETSNSPQPEGPCLDPQTDAHLVLAESAESETDEPQTIISPQKESMPEESPPAQPESLPDTSPQNKPKEKQKQAEPEQPQRRFTRRQLAMEMPEPYAKKLRSSTPSPGRPSSPPQASKKTKSAVKSVPLDDITEDQPPSKRARGMSVAAVEESHQEEGHQEEDHQEESLQEEGHQEESLQEEGHQEESLQEDGQQEEAQQEEPQQEEGQQDENQQEENQQEEGQQEEDQQEEGQQDENQQEEGQQEETGQAVVSEPAQADTESNSVLQRGGKKKEKRKLGILELATKEFEDESESDEAEAPDLQNPTETVTIEPTSTEALLPTADTHTSTQSKPDHGPRLQEDAQEPQASTSSCLPKTGGPEPATTEPEASEAVNATSKAHLFIFDSESQEEDSQSIDEDNPGPSSKPQPTVNKDAAFSLTQVQLEEDKKRVKELMNQTNQDLVSVTKALLRTSGDFAAAREQLLNPSSISGPFWCRCDDALLISADPAARQQLVERYSEEGVAKRILFLEVEG